jgi:hypothetical protein
MSDIQLHDGGSMIGFQPRTDAAYEFMDEHVHSESWQWLGPILWVDHRMARDLMQAMVDNDLELGA